MKRRAFISNLAVFTTAFSLTPSVLKAANGSGKLFFDISLAEWSLHNTLFSKQLSNLDFPLKSKNDFGINAVEYVNTFFESAKSSYVDQLASVTSNNGIVNVLIMCDGEGNLGASGKEERLQAVKNHYKWIEAAINLGCHSIRVNTRGEGTSEEVAGNAVDGLSRLTEYGAKRKINVIVENHGGYSSNGQWLGNVISRGNSDYCGTLPDFGNFCIDAVEDQVSGKWTCLEEYDRYKGVRELMKYAKGVSAKSNHFDENGYERNIDYRKMLQIVKNAGYKGYIGIEYEGDQLSEDAGIMATRELLEKIGKEIKS